MHRAAGDAAAFQAWVAAVRTRLGSIEAGSFSVSPGDAACVFIADPKEEPAWKPAVHAMKTALAHAQAGEAVLYSSTRSQTATGELPASGAAVKCSGGRVLGFTVSGARETAGGEQALLQHLATLVWHLKCADEAQASIPWRPVGLSAQELVDVLPLPCVLTDESGRAIERNEAFSDFMESTSVQIVTGRLRFDDHYLQDSWKVALREVHATALRQSLLAAAVDGRLWRVHLTPLHCVLHGNDTTQRELILGVAELQGAGVNAPLEAVMPDCTRPLTPAEGEVLSALLQGHPAKVIANSRGASVNTVRSQIMTILGKTGFHNQRSLIAAFAPSSFRNSTSPGLSVLPTTPPAAPRKR